ncbi:hypothetical protein E2562_031718 [Oryza meyeriana var. granulata]|uniref:Uncharacterized protein n=1 Tax=Oryza meyeriana var. granulata TaxID=110450 RepID=A0A6G1FEQ5_9ORYZ|nr:hypothetical protein E2562_031718 [Oryza meyeriana var. granulata]
MAEAKRRRRNRGYGVLVVERGGNRVDEVFPGVPKMAEARVGLGSDYSGGGDRLPPAAPSPADRFWPDATELTRCAVLCHPNHGTTPISTASSPISPCPDLYLPPTTSPYSGPPPSMLIPLR